MFVFHFRQPLPTAFINHQRQPSNQHQLQDDDLANIIEEDVTCSIDCHDNDRYGILLESERPQTGHIYERRIHKSRAKQVSSSCKLYNVGFYFAFLFIYFIFIQINPIYPLFAINLCYPLHFVIFDIDHLIPNGRFGRCPSLQWPSYISHLHLHFRLSNLAIYDYSFPDILCTIYSPLEKSWTYKCTGDKCVREHYFADQNNPADKRITYLSCAMICGSPNIWPMPTIKTSLGSQSLTFRSQLISLDIVTHFNEARTLMQQAFDIFEADLRALEGSKATSTDEVSTSSHEHTDSNTNKYSAADKNCDIKHIDVKVEISTIKEVYQHLEMDETYELTISSKCNLVSIKFGW